MKENIKTLTKDKELVLLEALKQNKDLLTISENIGVPLKTIERYIENQKVVEVSETSASALLTNRILKKQTELKEKRLDAKLLLANNLHDNVKNLTNILKLGMNRVKNFLDDCPLDTPTDAKRYISMLSDAQDLVRNYNKFITEGDEDLNLDIETTQMQIMKSPIKARNVTNPKNEIIDLDKDAENTTSVQTIQHKVGLHRTIRSSDTQ